MDYENLIEDLRTMLERSLRVTLTIERDFFEKDLSEFIEEIERED